MVFMDLFSNSIDIFSSDIYNDVSFSKPHARASQERDSVHELNVEAGRPK